MIHDLVQEGNSQFIIATHSPILLGYPDAMIYHFTKDGVNETTYEETDHVQITKYFLNNRQKMLKELLE